MPKTVILSQRPRKSIYSLPESSVSVLGSYLPENVSVESFSKRSSSQSEQCAYVSSSQLYSQAVGDHEISRHYRHRDGTWAIFFDEGGHGIGSEPGWWIAEEGNFGENGLIWCPGKSDLLPSTGWQWRGYLGYYEVDVHVELKEDLPEETKVESVGSAQKLAEILGDGILGCLRGMEMLCMKVEEQLGEKVGKKDGPIDQTSRPTVHSETLAEKNDFAEVTASLQEYVSLDEADPAERDLHVEVEEAKSNFIETFKVHLSKFSAEEELKNEAAAVKREFLEAFSGLAAAGEAEHQLRHKLADEALSSEELEGLLRASYHKQLEAKRGSQDELNTLKDKLANAMQKIQVLSASLAEGSDSPVEVDALLKEKLAISETKCEALLSDHVALRASHEQELTLLQEKLATAEAGRLDQELAKSQEEELNLLSDKLKTAEEECHTLRAERAEQAKQTIRVKENVRSLLVGGLEDGSLAKVISEDAFSQQESSSREELDSLKEQLAASEAECRARQAETTALWASHEQEINLLQDKLASAEAQRFALYAEQKEEGDSLKELAKSQEQELNLLKDKLKTVEESKSQEEPDLLKELSLLKDKIKAMEGERTEQTTQVSAFSTELAKSQEELTSVREQLEASKAVHLEYVEELQILRVQSSSNLQAAEEAAALRAQLVNADMKMQQQEEASIGAATRSASELAALQNKLSEVAEAYHLAECKIQELQETLKANEATVQLSPRESDLQKETEFLQEQLFKMHAEMSQSAEAHQNALKDSEEKYKRAGHLQDILSRHALQFETQLREETDRHQDTKAELAHLKAQLDSLAATAEKEPEQRLEGYWKTNRQPEETQPLVTTFAHSEANFPFHDASANTKERSKGVFSQVTTLTSQPRSQGHPPPQDQVQLRLKAPSVASAASAPPEGAARPSSGSRQRGACSEAGWNPDSPSIMHVAARADVQAVAYESRGSKAFDPESGVPRLRPILGMGRGAG
eukprot:TRINITY_DN8947_c0_g2_i1.p1 TRINITY_DN8947_c0_g2~~TRINITY_DN8947_c0_g2_i1.p1  ORF type:complete len:982 (-),score=279.73 TRINITY_DN8947_c0_g2_i1:138-3083(-)